MDVVKKRKEVEISFENVNDILKKDNQRVKNKEKVKEAI